jgi:hypothetical protein
MGLEFIAIENGRIMAGSDHNAAGRFPLLDSIRDRWSGHGTTRKHGLKSVGSENFGSEAGELIRKKSAVITDDDGFVSARVRLGRPRGGSGLDSALQIAESEILGDHSPPSVCAKFNVHAYQIP